LEPGKPSTGHIPHTAYLAQLRQPRVDELLVVGGVRALDRHNAQPALCEVQGARGQELRGQGGLKKPPCVHKTMAGHLLMGY